MAFASSLGVGPDQSSKQRYDTDGQPKAGYVLNEIDLEMHRILFTARILALARLESMPSGL